MSTIISPTSPRVLRLPAVRRKVGLGRSTIYRYMRDGAFPLPRAIGGRAIGWLEDEIDAWIAGRPRQLILLGKDGDELGA